MKTKFILASVLATAFTACHNNAYEINITFPQEANIADSTLVLLQDYKPFNVTIDSAYIINGKAHFSGNIEGTTLFQRIQVPNSRIYANVIIEPGVITLDIPNITATGTPLNDGLTEYNKWFNGTDNVFAGRFETIMRDTTLSSDDKTAQKNLLLEDYYRVIFQHADSVIQQNSDNALGCYAFWETYIVAVQNKITLEQYEAALAKAGDHIASFPPVALGTENIRNHYKTQAGNPFVDFTIEDGKADGTPVKLSDYVGKGKVVLVDFWASWCVPCRRAVPYIKAVAEKYADKDFEVVGIAVRDVREHTLKAIEEEGITWNVIFDTNSISAGIYGVDGIPELMLIDKDGTIIDRSFSPNAIDTMVSKALAE